MRAYVDTVVASREHPQNHLRYVSCRACSSVTLNETGPCWRCVVQPKLTAAGNFVAQLATRWSPEQLVVMAERMHSHDAWLVLVVLAHAGFVHRNAAVETRLRSCFAQDACDGRPSGLGCPQ